MGDALGAGVGPVGRPERIVHVQVAQLRKAPRELGVIGLFPGIEAGVLAQSHAAAGHSAGEGSSSVAGGIIDESDGRAEQRFQRTNHRLERVLGVRTALGPPEVREEDDPGALLTEVPDGGKRRAYAAVVGDQAILHRHVEVHPHQCALAIEAYRLERREAPLHPSRVPR